MSFTFATPCVENIREIEKALTFLRNRVNGATFKANTLARFSTVIGPTDPLMYLSNACELGLERYYFDVRDKSRTYAGIGVATILEGQRFAQLPDLLVRANTLIKETDAAWFAGIAHADTSPQWPGFAAIQLVLPLIDLRFVNGQYTLAVNLIAATQAAWLTMCATLQQQLSHLANIISSSALPAHTATSAEQTPRSSAAPVFLKGQYSCGYSNWESLIKQSLQALDLGQLKKVVLARKVSLIFKNAPNIFTLLGQLHDTAGYRYAFENQKKCFFGCSPERLFLKNQLQLITESLAGTVGRGNDALTDKKIAADLLNIEKLVNEHQVVTDGIRESIQPLVSTPLNISDVDVVQFAGVQHAYQTIEAKLKKNVSLSQIILSLHPTPAVCGYPQQTAAEFIHNNEILCRSWYAGTVGIITKDICEFAVSIRSGVCDGPNVELFSGVGIVKGSHAREEWSELNAKLSPWLGLLGVNERSIDASE